MGDKAPGPFAIGKFIVESLELFQKQGFTGPKLQVALGRAVMLRFITPPMTLLSDAPDAVRAREYKKKIREELRAESK